MRINGLGCSLVDNLYYPVDFNSSSYRKYSAETNSGAGIITGGLVFAESLEKFFGKDYREIIFEITGGKIKPVRNVGGPSIVALIHMSQVMSDRDVRIRFYGARGRDVNGSYLAKKLPLFGIDIGNYAVTCGHTPFTDVLSDPSFNDEIGERSFINFMGAAGEMDGADLPDSFFDADILLFGGTALTPGLHKDLGYLLKRGKTTGACNFVNTVYDFKSQMENPGRPWPLVDSEEYGYIDLLIADNEEALRISGTENKTDALDYFIDKGVKALIITHGAEDVVCFSRGQPFLEEGIFQIPVSEVARDQIRNASNNTPRDTTGCGDNFAGGVYASLARQKMSSRGRLSLKQAAAWGIVSGGFAGLYQGGVFFERERGEKLEKLTPFLKDYEKQTGVKYE